MKDAFFALCFGTLRKCDGLWYVTKRDFRPVRTETIQALIRRDLIKIIERYSRDDPIAVTLR